jgi:hypothetical protein
MRELVAYRLEGPPLDLVPGSHARGWMDASPGRFAYRCLPVVIANQAGWMVLNRGRVTVTWQGGTRPGDCTIECEDVPEPPLSHFGSGIVTWRIPWLFRTPAGWSLLMRGPANLPKDGASSLEGVIETDWAVQPAFHSWKLTRVGHPVTWEDGEPLCMLVPIRRADLEAWTPVARDVGDDEVLRAEYALFADSRTAFNASDRGNGWQKHYFQGRAPGLARAPDGSHATRLHLRRFTEAPTTARPPSQRQEERSMTELPKEYKEIQHAARRVSGKAKYPLHNFNQVAEALGGENAEVTYEGKPHKIGDAKKVLPDGFFPIESEEDLIAKASYLRARLRPGERDHVPGEQRDKPDPGAGDPKFPKEESPRKGGIPAIVGHDKQQQ